MAFVYPGTTCKICSNELGENYDKNNVIGMPDIIYYLSDFHSFRDGVIHQSCFQTWDKAEDLVKALNSKNSEEDQVKAVITKDGRLEYV